MEQKQNPWLTIWTQPRATISKIIAVNPDQSLWALSFIYGFCSLMNTFQSMAFGNSMGTLGLLILALIIAPFWGWINISVWSLVVSWTSRLFKGQGNFKTIRSAYAWSIVPMVLNIPFWIALVAIFGEQLFLNFPDADLLPNGLLFFLFATLVIKVILAIWSLVIYLNTLAQVQSYSVLKAVLNVIVAGILIAAVMFVFWTVIFYALGGVAAFPLTLLNP